MKFEGEGDSPPDQVQYSPLPETGHGEPDQPDESDLHRDTHDTQADAHAADRPDQGYVPMPPTGLAEPDANSRPAHSPTDHADPPAQPSPLADPGARMEGGFGDGGDSGPSERRQPADEAESAAREQISDVHEVLANPPPNPQAARERLEQSDGAVADEADASRASSMGQVAETKERSDERAAWEQAAHDLQALDEQQTAEIRAAKDSGATSGVIQPIRDRHAEARLQAERAIQEAYRTHQITGSVDEGAEGPSQSGDPADESDDGHDRQPDAEAVVAANADRLQAAIQEGERRMAEPETPMDELGEVLEEARSEDDDAMTVTFGLESEGDATELRDELPGGDKAARSTDVGEGAGNAQGEGVAEPAEHAEGSGDTTADAESARKVPEELGSPEVVTAAHINAARLGLKIAKRTGHEAETPDWIREFAARDLDHPEIPAAEFAKFTKGQEHVDKPFKTVVPVGELAASRDLGRGKRLTWVTEGSPDLTHDLVVDPGIARQLLEAAKVRELAVRFHTEANATYDNPKAFEITYTGSGQDTAATLSLSREEFARRVAEEVQRNRKRLLTPHSVEEAWATCISRAIATSAYLMSNRRSEEQSADKKQEPLVSTVMNVALHPRRTTRIQRSIANRRWHVVKAPHNISK